MFNDESTNSHADTPSVSAPNETRLYNKYGPVDRRELLRAATTGIVGTILSARSANATSLFSRLMGDSNALMPAASAAEAEALRLATLGDYVWLTPTKLGGGVQAQDLATGKTMAWIEYWNYGDSCPIAHHLAAFPSPDPRKGFEFVNSTQGGQNVLIYGIPTQIREHGMLDPLWGQGNQIYRVGFDGQQMNLLENIAETTGIGLGVHTVIFPDASGFSVCDGQKDIVAFFKRATGNSKTQVIEAFRFDWFGNEPDGLLEDNWFKGGKVRITRLVKAPETGLYDYRGTKGNKLDWEMVPMGEYLVYTGQLPGDSVKIADRRGQLRPPSDPSPVACHLAHVRRRRRVRPHHHGADRLHFLAGGNDRRNYPRQEDRRRHLGDQARQGGDLGSRVRFRSARQMVHHDQQHPAEQHGRVRLPRSRPAKMDSGCGSSRTRIGSAPRQVPFHITYSMDGSKMFVSELHQKPAKSAIVVVDTNTWTTIKRFENVGVDTQTMHVTYDGKYVLAIFSGFQRLEGGTFIFTQDTLEPVGYHPELRRSP